MSDLAVEIVGLTKRYRGRPPRNAVDHLSLAVPSGSVFGLLGPNGAGKTTTIRAMLGLIRPTSGTMTLLGTSIPSDIAKVRQQIGAIVETPKFTPGFSARRNLALLARAKGTPLSQVDELLATVGLADRASSRFSSFSLGMKQRLAVASTLLGDPQLLILDEPANGLDPAGIAEMRELVRSIASQGRTVIISSHQLADIERMCDHVAILRNGRLVEQGSVHDLLTQRGSDTQVLVAPELVATSVQVLSHEGFGVTAVDGPTGRLTVEHVDDASLITQTLANSGIYLRGLGQEHRSLEEVFLDITQPDEKAV